MWIQLLAGGLAVGGVYALFALGFALIFGVLGIAQFAHGGVYMLAAFGALSTIPYLHIAGPLQFVVLILIGLGLGGLLGLAIERGIFRPLAQAPHVSSIIGAIGLMIVFQYLAVEIWGPGLVNFHMAWSPGAVTVGSLSIPTVKVVIVAVALVLLGCLQLILLRTRLGRAMRAVALDPDTSRLMGINASWTSAAAFVIASALAGSAGVLVSALYGVTYSSMGVAALVKGYTATVIGGVGNLTGAVVAGFGIGVLEVLLTNFVPPQVAEGSLYVLLLVVLIARPQGLMGRTVVEKL